MGKKQEQAAAAADVATQPFFYEIRVRGRLSDEQWTAWFSNLTLSTQGGETVLRGTLPDHAALYGLLARLRDLAVPLLSVRVLDAEAQRKLQEQSRRNDLLINGLLLVVYLTLVGGMVAITTFLTSGGVLHTALALAALFTVLGMLSFAISLWSGHQAWRWLSYVAWVASVITFFVYTSVANLLPAAVAIGLLLLLLAGGLIYLLSYLRSRAERVNSIIVEWRSLGRRVNMTETEAENDSVDQGAAQ
jgi:uncharacterized membrane-anchored protein